MEQERKLKPWMLNLALVMVGVVFATVMVLVFLTMFPQFRPGMVVFRVKLGDIFFNHPEWMAIPENYEEILSVHYVGYDQDGFRLPERQASDYQILGVGDSFTEAANVARPWTDTLAQKSGMTVKNLGWRGFGPVEEANVIAEYAPESGAEYIVVGFFEGNDLANALKAQTDAFPMPDEMTDADRVMREVDFNQYPERDERYPMKMMLGGQEQDIAFYEWYVWGLNGTENTYRRSSNMDYTVQSWEQMRQVAEAEGKCLILAYFPSKEHIYVPYLTPESQEKLLSKAHVQFAADGQPLNNAPEATTFDELVSRLGNLRNAVQRRAERTGMIFFDTTPVLQQAAANGELVYYVYDTHWNQRGHDLVGDALANFIAQHPCRG